MGLLFFYLKSYVSLSFGITSVKIITNTAMIAVMMRPLVRLNGKLSIEESTNSAIMDNRNTQKTVTI